MIQVGTELKPPFNAAPGNSLNIRKENKTLVCRVEARKHGLVMVVTGVLQDIPLQENEKQA